MKGRGLKAQARVHVHCSLLKCRTPLQGLVDVSLNDGCSQWSAFCDPSVDIMEPVTPVDEGENQEEENDPSFQLSQSAEALVAIKEQGEDQNVHRNNEKAHTVDTRKVADLNQNRMCSLGVTDKTPGKPREELSPNVFENDPGSGREEERETRTPHPGEQECEKGRVKGQVSGKGEENDHADGEGEASISFQDHNDPVHQGEEVNQPGR